MRIFGQKGFTLIELMISLVLGLLIVAAVMQVYMMTIRTNTIQESGSNIQNASIFGIQKLEDALRMANLGNSTTIITDKTYGGGIVFGQKNVCGIANGLTTKLDAGESNMEGQQSDQLTISYRNTTGRILSDCEGASVNPDEMVIERYYLGGTSPDLHLYCKAGRLQHNNGVVTGISSAINGDGSRFIENVDQFKILLGIQNGQPTASTVRVGYLTATQYASTASSTVFPCSASVTAPATTASTTNPIISIRVAIVARGGTAVLGETSATTFNVFGASQTLNASATARPQVRAVYETNVLLRNARATYVAR